MSKKLIITLNDIKLKALNELMKADMETNKSAYVGRLITQEVIRRSEEAKKRGVGRPVKEKEEDLYYPAPYEGGAPYKKEDWLNYFAFRKEPAPELPEPLTKEELKKWDL